ncbi:MAG: cysteine desulfurase [Bacteroidia bacterium]|nr:cysteine desulfurase [Bacteroidia bacterium]
MAKEASYYFDYNATTPLHEEVLEAMLPWMKGICGNASSLHGLGRKSRRAVEKAREQAAALLQCQPEEIFFTSGATESLNLCLRGLTEAYFSDGARILSQATEHKSVLDTLSYLKSKNHQVEIIPYKKITETEYALNFQPSLMALMWANNETGEIFPVEKYASLAEEHRFILITDATQAVGKIDINLQKVPLHALAFSGHKIYGPQGIGVLFLRRGRVRLNPVAQITGGGHQEGIRSGSLPVALIVGLGKACELIKSRHEEWLKHTSHLRDTFEKHIKEKIPDAIIVSEGKARIGNTSMVIFPRTLQNIGELWEVFSFSSGSACTSEKPEPSHVLLSMDFEKEKVKNAYRFSFGLHNTLEATEELVRALVSSLS